MSLSIVTDFFLVSTQGASQIIDVTPKVAEVVRDRGLREVVLVDFDNRPRQRDIVVQLTGERD